ncbi:hypothetical protein Goklo_008051 [Gossypium klotzschianum]|uniref:Uncharacterized protein n=1 Tax=Gossypium klotzschianum TaxID=34286 RepID=A0A7J8UYN3_9ROSI|nr:hypothetical protein [Gossypium klotzschianum]
MVHVLRDCLAMRDNISWSATEMVKVSISWARQFQSYFSGYKSNIPSLNPINISYNTRVFLSTDGAVNILDEILILLNKGYRKGHNSN